MSTLTKTPAIPGIENQWLPFTPNRDFKDDPRIFTRAQGIYFYGPDGNAILDGCSSLFTTPAGHARTEIAEAVHKQVLELDYTSSFARSHPLSSQVCQTVAELLPNGIDHVFLVNSGSESIDTAVKIAQQYHRRRREASRTIFVSRERAYHGSNLSGVALGGLANNRRSFGAPMLPVVHMRHTWLKENRFQPGEGCHGAELADDLLAMIRLHGAENIAACIVEPIAGSTGVLVPPAGYLTRLREICDEHGILLIFDEVICGFGRTGSAFAAQSFGVTPDIITMAKAITNGVVPMGAVAVANHVYQTVVESAPAHETELFHGYTASAHPLACAACMASQKIYRDENLFTRASDLSPYFLRKLFSLEGTPGITDIRGYGLLGGFDIDPLIVGLNGYAFQKRLFDKGLHLKSTGNSVIVAPPFVATEADIDRIIDTVAETCRNTN